MPTEAEMLADLDTADKAGDSDLAQHIAGQINAARESQPSGPRAFIDHAANGVLLNFGDEVGGAGKAAAHKVLPESMGGAPAGTPIGDIYRSDRDRLRGLFDQGKAAHPNAALAGDIIGGVVPALFSSGAGVLGKGLGLGARLLRAAVSGAAYGGASGLGSSTADLTKGEAVPAALDAGKGALAGAAMAGGVTLAGAGIGPLAAKLREASTNTARRFLSGTTSSLSNKIPLSNEAVEEAFSQGAIRPFSTIHTASDKLQNATEDVGDVYNKIVQALRANGIDGPNAELLAQKYVSEQATAAQNSMNSAVPGVFGDAAKQLGSKSTNAAGNLDLQQAENLRRSLQGMAKSAYKQMRPDEEGQALKRAASMLRQANEDAISQGVKANGDPVVQAIGAQFVPIKQQLSRLIPASEAAEAASNRALKNHAVGLKEAALAAGDPLRFAGSMLAKTRGSSTLAYGLRGASKAADALTPAAQPATRQQMLADMLRRIALRESQEQAGDTNAP